jgi:hypothetical protein
MGIAPYVAEAIIREHKFKPILGEALLLGRQTMLFSPEDALGLIRGHGLQERVSLDQLPIDRQTRASEGHSFIRDDAFFRLLGVEHMMALDHTAYEGAGIIHNLNLAIPENLDSIADFILDGSTLDNLFNPAMGLMNIARMLKPGGRLISVNMGSAHRGPYTIPTPFWFLDYFAVNAFTDCRAYLTLHGDHSQSVLIADPAATVGQTLPSGLEAGIFIFAEKGQHSTWDRMPDQRQYAGDAMRASYAAAAQAFAASKRPHLLVSTNDHGAFTLIDSMRGHYRTAAATEHFKLVAPDGELREIRTPWPLKLRRSLAGIRR